MYSINAHPQFFFLETVYSILNCSSECPSSVPSAPDFSDMRSNSVIAPGVIDLIDWFQSELL